MAKYRKSFVERIKPTGFKDLLRRIVLLICVCVFCYSAYNLGSIHSDIDKKEFRAGSIFIASENENPFVDLNTVIYGHNMNNGSMFNNIKSYTKQEFANEHPYVYIYLPDGTVSRYKVVAAHIIPEKSVLYNTAITDIQAFYEEMLKTSSIEVDFDKTLNNPVITLSTCTSRGSDSGERNVVHAVLDKAGIDPKVDKMEE